jgi:hypothetical protein
MNVECLDQIHSQVRLPLYVMRLVNMATTDKGTFCW